MTRMKIILTIIAIIIISWLILPTLIMIPVSFNSAASFAFPPKGFSLKWYVEFLTNPLWMRSLMNSLLIGILTALFATVLGVLAALGIQGSATRWARRVENFLLLPLMVPGIVLAIGLYSLFLRLNLLGTIPGFVFAHTVVALPLVITNVLASLKGIDPNLVRASAITGYNHVESFFRVTLPLIVPGVTAGALFAFVTSFDEIIVSLFIQSPQLQTLPVRIYASVTQSNDPTVAAGAVLTMVVVVIMIVIVQTFTTKRKRVS